MSIISDSGAVFPSELDSVIDKLPAELKRVYITTPSGDLDTLDENVVHPDKYDVNRAIREDPRVIYDDQGNAVDYDMPKLPEMPLQAPAEPRGELKMMEPLQTVPEENSSVEPPRAFDSVDWSKLNQEFGSLRSTSKEDTPVVATTASPLITIREGDIKESMDVAIGAGPASIAGVRAATIPKSALYLAQDAERQGFSADEIFKSTGFFKGADNSWKWEIDDSAAKLNERWADNPSPTQKAVGMKIAKLPEVIDHPELYEAYPQLKNYQVIYDNNFTGIAEFSGEAIRVGKRAFSGDTPAYKDKSIIMHEVQHAIQDIEGFAKGGSPLKTVRGEYKLKYESDVNQLRPEVMDLFAKERKGELLSEKEQGRLDYLKAVFDKYTKYQEAGDKEAFKHYQELAGEVEARNVQSRIDLTPSERMRINPIDTEDVKRSEQLVRRQASGATPYVKIHPYDKQVDFLSY